jgi:hypothetical protein
MTWLYKDLPMFFKKIKTFQVVVVLTIFDKSLSNSFRREREKRKTERERETVREREKEKDREREKERERES